MIWFKDLFSLLIVIMEVHSYNTVLCFSLGTIHKRRRLKGDGWGILQKTMLGDRGWYPISDKSNVVCLSTEQMDTKS